MCVRFNQLPMQGLPRGGTDKKNLETPTPQHIHAAITHADTHTNTLAHPAIAIASYMHIIAIYTQ